MLPIVHSTLDRGSEQLAPHPPSLRESRPRGHLSLVWAYPSPGRFPIPYLHVMDNNTQGGILRYFPTTNTTGRHLGFGRDFNYHTSFRACYVIVHKVYSMAVKGNPAMDKHPFQGGGGCGSRNTPSRFMLNPK